MLSRRHFQFLHIPINVRLSSGGFVICRTTYSTVVWATNYGFSPTYTNTTTYNDYLNADGYGTLNLPGGLTYLNCLRIKQRTIDSTSATPYMDTVYYWLTPGTHHPVLEVHANSPWRDAYYILDKGSVAGIKTNKSNQISSVSPNPANDKIILTVPLNDKCPVAVWNIYGQIFEVSAKQISVGQIEMDVSKLPEGVYFITAGRAPDVTVRKFVIAR